MVAVVARRDARQLATRSIADADLHTAATANPPGLHPGRLA